MDIVYVTNNWKVNKRRSMEGQFYHVASGRINTNGNKILKCGENSGRIHSFSCLFVLF